MIMIDRKEYMDGKVTHREYYAQFVNPVVKSYLLSQISLKEILASKDPHFNDIPLHRWDRLPKVMIHKLREAGDVNADTLSNKVCIYKEAARQIRETEAK